jgi:uncharacterized protein (DUF486 family)
MRALGTVILLFGSNIFMTWAWYGHLKQAAWSIPLAIGISWLIALPEYVLQVPANRIGHVSQGGPFSAAQLKVVQEAITLIVFLAFAILVLKERPRINEYIAFALILAGVAIAMLGRTEEPRAARIIEAPAEFTVPALACHADAPEPEADADERPVQM